MPVQTATCGGHLVAAEAADLRFGILPLDLLDQVGGMQISRCFACYDEVPLSCHQ